MTRTVIIATTLLLLLAAVGCTPSDRGLGHRLPQRDIYAAPAPAGTGDEVVDHSSEAISVTPFDSPDDPEGEEGDEGGEELIEQHGIPDEKRDARIDELIDWGEFSKAYELATELLEFSVSKKHENYIGIYKAYIRLLKPRVGLHLRDKDKIEE